MQQTNQPGPSGGGAYPPLNPNQPYNAGPGGAPPSNRPPYPPGTPKKRSNMVLFIVLGVIAVIVVLAAVIVLTVPAGPAAISNAVLAKDFQNKSAVNVTTTFAPTDSKIYCVINLDNPKATTKVKSVWYVVSAGELQNQKITEAELVTANGENLITFPFTATSTLPTGTYKVDILLDGTLNRTLNFTVQ